MNRRVGPPFGKDVMNDEVREKPAKDRWYDLGYWGLEFIITGMQLEHLLEYSAVVSKAIVDESQAFQKRIDAEVALYNRPGDDETRDNIYEHYHDNFWKLDSVFPMILRYTTFAAACSRIDAGLATVCKEIDKADKIQKRDSRWPEKGSSTLNKAKDFLSKNFGLVLSKHDIWPKIKDYFELRHCVMHAEGDIDLMRNDEHLRIIVRKFKDLGVGISSIGALELEQKFVETVVKDVTLFWRDFEVSVNQNKTLGPVFLP